MWKGTMRVVYLAGFIAALVVFLAACSPSGETPPGGASSPAETAPIKMDVETLVAEYDKNDAAANVKYKGKQMEVTGVITGFGSDLFGNPTVFFSISEERRTGMLVTFDKSKADTVRALSEGQRVTILGVCDGLRIYVQLKYASVVK